MTRDNERIEVVMVVEQRRRRWSAAEKSALVRQTYEPGISASLVARQHGVAASQLFNWRKLEREGALTAVSAGESVVLASVRAQIAQLQRLLGKKTMEASVRAQIAQLQRLLGKKTMEAEILEEAVELAREKSGLRARPCWARTTSEAGLPDSGCGARMSISSITAATTGLIRHAGSIDAMADAMLIKSIKAEITELPTYGYRRAGALVNRSGSLSAWVR